MQTGRLQKSKCEPQKIHSLHNEGPALQESRSTQQICRLRELQVHECEVMSFRSCGCFPRMWSIWFRERGQDHWTMSKSSPGELQLSISRPEGCKNPRVHSSGYTFVAQWSSTARVKECSSDAGSGSSGCMSARPCRSAIAAAFRECGATNSASAARTSGPCTI